MLKLNAYKFKLNLSFCCANLANTWTSVKSCRQTLKYGAFQRESWKGFWTLMRSTLTSLEIFGAVFGKAGIVKKWNLQLFSKFRMLNFLSNFLGLNFISFFKKSITFSISLIPYQQTLKIIRYLMETWKKFPKHCFERWALALPPGGRLSAIAASRMRRSIQSVGGESYAQRDLHVESALQETVSSGFKLLFGSPLQKPSYC